MHLAVYLPLVMPLLAAAAVRLVAGRLPPVAATWLPPPDPEPPRTVFWVRHPAGGKLAGTGSYDASGA
jgi:hypothetical protein